MPQAGHTVGVIIDKTILFISMASGTPVGVVGAHWTSFLIFIMVDIDGINRVLLEIDIVGI